MKIRPETEVDLPAVYELNVAAFETNAEADLVEALRRKVINYISLVAEAERRIVGHIMFTPVRLVDCSSALIMGLAPMAVIEDCRNQGIGSALIESGIESCVESKAGAIVVLGHPNYYPKFGFKAASKFNLSCEYDVPDDVFMAMEIVPDYLAEKSGVVKYHESFAGV